MHILVTGATGYIGGRLVPLLVDAGHRLRVLVRDRRRIVGRPWADRVEVTVGDVGYPDSLRGAFEGIDTVYYLVHSMYSGADYARRDREAAENFAREVQGAGSVRHLIYLGGLLPSGGRVSQHLASRAEVGQILRNYLAATEFRAGPIIGSGSASFEMVRYLTERLPVMVAPIWILNLVQPIAVRDILRYLIAALEREPLGVIEVGADRLTFKKMMHVFAELRGLRRVIIPVPVLAPRLAALWIGLVTPIPNSLAVPLVEGVVGPVLADTRRARELFPDIVPLSYREAVRRALERVEHHQVETRWSGALGQPWILPPTPSVREGGPARVGDSAGVHPATPESGSGVPTSRGAEEMQKKPSVSTHGHFDQEGVIREVRTLQVDLPPESVFRSFSSLGGERGWLVWKWAWELRGAFDRVIGGPGIRRGRRHPTELLPGESVDFWRVEAVDPPRLLRLRAEMKVPGQAWLQWEALPEGGGTRLVQTAVFVPKGFLGAAYWYSLYPVHKIIFSDLVHALARDAHRFRDPLPVSSSQDVS